MSSEDILDMLKLANIALFETEKYLGTVDVNFAFGSWVRRQIDDMVATLDKQSRPGRTKQKSAQRSLRRVA